MSGWLRRYVFEEVPAGEVAATHLLECGHRRRPLYTPTGAPRRWQYCPDCYRGHAPTPASPPPELSISIRCRFDDALWLARTLASLIRRGDLEHVDSARRVAQAAELAARHTLNPNAGDDPWLI